MEPIYLIFLSGAAVGASLIAAIGAQNAFVLTQGIRQEYHWQIGLTCALIDTILIFSGAAGMGALIEKSPLFLTIATWGGISFLLIYGLKSLRSAFKKNTLNINKTPTFNSLYSALVATCALSLLNPHVYLDTLILLGSLASQYGNEGAYWFAAGAASFSFVWFLSISFAARLLTPVFKKPRAWQVLDVAVFVTLWSIAISLLHSQIIT